MERTLPIPAPPPPVPRADPAPIPPGERIDAVDIVRGFALFGVLALNMLAFAGPAYLAGPWEVSTRWWDRLAELVLLIGGESAFYSTFSLLFGLGFALQLDRALARGQSRWVFARRMAVLLGFGLVHAVLIWDGDILVQYAVTGFALLAFARASARTARWWSIGLASTMVVLGVGVVAAALAFGDITPTTAADVASDAALIENGSILDLATDRLDEVVSYAIITLVSVPWFLALFLAGTWLVRSGRVADWRNQRPFLLRVLAVSVPVAIAAKGTLAVLIVTGRTGLAEVATFPLTNLIGGPALGATYVSLVVLALQRDGVVARALGHLGPVGRMALTNYLSQSLIAVTFFYGWGLGNYGRWGVAVGLGLTVVLFAIQMVWSRLWLARFRYGPMEWLWRTLTYGQAPAITRST